MTARQHRILWLAKKALIKKYPYYYTLTNDAITDYIDGEEPCKLGTGNSYDILCYMFYGERNLIDELLKDNYLNKKTLIYLFENRPYGMNIKEIYSL